MSSLLNTVLLLNTTLQFINYKLAYWRASPANSCSKQPSVGEFTKMLLDRHHIRRRCFACKKMDVISIRHHSPALKLQWLIA